MNKYFPPDFDHTKIPKQERSKVEKIKERFVVRMMLPMSVRCQTCGEYMYKGKKFNSRKENVEGPDGDYLGIQIFRFYFKCVTCSAEFTIKTDPKNMDYVVEGGAKANFELWKAEAQEKKEIEAERTEGTEHDAMKKLENKTEESKRAMDILDALDEIRTQNARAASVGIDDVLEHRKRALETKAAAAESSLLAEDELEAQRVFAAASTKRVREDEEVATTVGAGGVWGAAGSSSASAWSTSAACGTCDSTGDGAVAARSDKKPITGGAAPGTKAPSAGKKAKLPFGMVVQPKTAASAPQPPSGPVTSAPSAPSAPLVASGVGGDGGGSSLLGLGAYDSSGSGSGSD